jgi:chromosome segregation protein
LVQFIRLRLAGFKSFVDPTDLAILPGMTGIVGPNGCGKSNLVEALRWAMGETSAKRMRGSEMDDVIFSGTASRPARNMAEVVLHLDNKDRNVPAQFNEAEELEIIRRIDRGEGSLYKVNGKEARARDVQLLFADAATGAHSTALVSQGRVGAIINAKPIERRALLEEAAGITGLHSRRHEAELRLKAAEANLARLDDVIITIESQLAALKKQARQASRYRNLQDQIRRQEATLLHLVWLDARLRGEAAETALAAASASVIALTSEAAIAATRQSEAAAVLPGLRQAEAEAAAQLQRLTIERAQLDDEAQRVAKERADCERQLAELNADTSRELALAADASEAIAGLRGEHEQLRASEAEEAAKSEGTQRRLSLATAEVEDLDGRLAEAGRQLAEVEARTAAIERRRADLSHRLEILNRRQSEIETERQSLAGQISGDLRLAEARLAVEEARAALESAQGALAKAESERIEAQSADSHLREALRAMQATHARLKGEADAIAAQFEDSAGRMWPPLIDKLSVAPGYEAALGTALGDDLAASSDAGAPVHWRQVDAADQSPPLPEGMPSLLQFVAGSEVLARRLSQIGVAPDEASATAFAGKLAQGQRLTTRSGGLWRWDGFTVRPGEPTTAAKRLQQRNRLAAIEQDAGAIEVDIDAMGEKIAAARARLEAGQQAEREARTELSRSIETERLARDQASAALAALSQLNAKLAAAIEAERATKADLDEASEEEARLAREFEALPAPSGLMARVSELRPVLAEARARLVQCQSEDELLRRQAQQRRAQLAAIDRDLESWSRREVEAKRQLTSFAQRRAALDLEISRLEQLPDAIERRKLTLLDFLDGANAKRREAADALAEAETRLSEADKRLKAQEARLVEAREDKVRAEAGVAQAGEAMATLRERVKERLDCAPDEMLQIAGLDPGEDLPAREQADQRLQRLLRERENIGPVNLRAEVESEELAQQLSGMQSERSDLINAIARLRQGINSLNREGRERLLAAFELVNGHFEKLFVRLFGGGRAHLKLTEAEDPLDAGLEILAQPPGKKLQVMSLLSGGEQALTALALLFAVFLTNPAPICVLDEVDAPLDDANVERFCDLVEELSQSTATRFLVITHHRLTMARMDRLYGVTMAERGVSQLVSVDLEEAEELKAAE